MVREQQVLIVKGIICNMEQQETIGKHFGYHTGSTFCWTLVVLVGGARWRSVLLQLPQTYHTTLDQARDPALLPATVIPGEREEEQIWL